MKWLLFCHASVRQKVLQIWILLHAAGSESQHLNIEQFIYKLLKQSANFCLSPHHFCLQKIAAIISAHEGLPAVDTYFVLWVFCLHSCWIKNKAVVATEYDVLHFIRAFLGILGIKHRRLSEVHFNTILHVISIMKQVFQSGQKVFICRTFVK